MLEIFQYTFMVRALLAGLVLGLVAPTIGIFFVVRRYSAMADTLAHVSLAGIAGGLFLGISTVWSALGASIVALLSMERLREQRTLASDTIVSLFLFGGLALGVVLIGLRPAGGINIANYLFGSILTVTPATLQSIAVVGGVTFVLTLLLWRPFFAVALDEDVARASGMPVNVLNRLMAIFGAATIAMSINVVGMLLIGALMVIPVLAAMSLRVGFRTTWVVAVAVSLFSVFGGLVGSFYLNLASGATIVLTTVLCFILMALGTTLVRRYRVRGHHSVMKAL